MIKISYLQEYVLLAENLNFGRAAELLHITQPALSRHIVELEEEMGAKLLNRSTRSVQLTLAGETVYHSFREILKLYEEAQEKAMSLAIGKSGILRISSPYYWTEDYTEPLVSAFWKKKPDCDLQILSCQPYWGMKDMHEGRSDIALDLFFTQPDSCIRYVPFAEESLGVVMNASHSLAGRDGLYLEDIAENDLVLFEETTYENQLYNAAILELFEKRGIRPKHILYTQHIDTLSLTIGNTDCVSVMPYGVRHMDRSYIRMSRLLNEDCKIPVCIYYRMDNDNVLIPQFIQSALQAHFV